MKTIWFDVNNVPHVNFLLPIINRYRDRYSYVFTVRDFAETEGLFVKRIGEPYALVGKHAIGNKFSKLLAMFNRAYKLNKIVKCFDVKISVGGMDSGLVARWRRKPSIAFDDNDLSPNWMYAPLTDLAFFPRAITFDSLKKYGFGKTCYQYNGYKEDFYLADYVPNGDFLNILPWKQYVVVRPENIKANYVSGNISIVPELLRLLKNLKINVLFLPRYKSDIEYAVNYDNVFIPNEAINGLDACYFSDAVLTGAGTMAREAACLGVPAVSFFAGDKLLAVDKLMVDSGKLFFSRNPNEIVNFVENTQGKNPVDLNRCKKVQQEIFEKLDNFLSQI